MNPSDKGNHERFRDAMAQFPSGIAIITTDGPAGRWGLTATSVCSVSDAPPTLLVCINRESRANSIVRTNHLVTVNLLAFDQVHLALRFARKTESDLHAEFLLDHWVTELGRAPLLANAVANLTGCIVQQLEMASHTVFFISIEYIESSQDRMAAVYHRRSTTTLAPVQHN